MRNQRKLGEHWEKHKDTIQAALGAETSLDDLRYTMALVSRSQLAAVGLWGAGTETLFTSQCLPLWSAVRLASLPSPICIQGSIKNNNTYLLAALTLLPRAACGMFRDELGKVGWRLHSAVFCPERSCLVSGWQHSTGFEVREVLSSWSSSFA